MSNTNPKKTDNLIKIYGLGQFLIKYGNKEKDMNDWTSEKALKMFKYFVLNRHKEIYNEELVEVFWPDIDPETGKKRLYNTIYLLRKNIGIKDIVINRTTSYKFNEKYSCWTDWEQFNQIYENLKKDVAIEELKKAVELYQGDLMPGLRYEYWVEDIRTNLKEKYLDIIYNLSEKLYKEDKYIDALKYLKKGINEELYREEYYNLAMQILAKTGRIYEAITLFDRYSSMIKSDLGIEPGDEVVETFNKIKNCELIKKHTENELATKGALRCDREIFNKIYELEHRQVKRSDKSFTVLELNFSDIQLEENLSNLCEEIGALFRSGDVICCYDKIIKVLLHDMDVEKTYYILNRLFDLMKQKNINKKPEFDFKEISGK